MAMLRTSSLRRDGSASGFEAQVFDEVALGGRQSSASASESRFESVPQQRWRTAVAGGEAEGDDGQIAGDAVCVHAAVEPAEVDEDHDVRHVEAVADAAVEGQRPATQRCIERIARAGRGDRGEHRTGEAQW